MINKLKRTIFTYFAIPFVGLTLLFLFFFVVLQPAQRSAIIKNILASLPIAKNFVNVHYKTHLNVTGIADAKLLKTSFISVDFLASIRNSKGVNYIAVYPYQVEAGFDLDKIIVDNENKYESNQEYRKINIHLPAPRIVTADLDDKSSVMVVRGEMKGNSEYITRPVRIAFEKQAEQYSLQKNILEKAKQNAEAYYKNLMKGIYDEIDVSFDESEERNLSQIKLPLIPLNFTLNNEIFNYEFNGSEEMEPVAATFKKDNSKISVGYSQKSKKSYADLWKALKNDSSNQVFLKFIDPVSPIKNGVVCEYGKSSDAVCYVQKGDNLFFLHHSPTNDESAKMTIADILYASFNTSSYEIDSEAQRYIEFVNLLKEAHRELTSEKFANLKMTAQII
jgi:hypothetical protein